MKYYIYVIIICAWLTTGCTSSSSDSPAAQSTVTAPVIASQKVMIKAPQANAAVINDISSPCRSFRLACASAGFALGKTTVGNRLIRDCMLLLVAGTPAVNSTTGLTAQIPPNTDGAICASHIHMSSAPAIGMHFKSAPKFASSVKGSRQ